MQGGERPQVGLLRQVVGRLPVAERHAQPPDVGLGRPDEGGSRQRVARPRRRPRCRPAPPYPHLPRPMPARPGTREASADDQCSMASCSTVREALSARLDGEPLGMPEAALDQHLSGCAACASGPRRPPSSRAALGWPPRRRCRISPPPSSPPCPASCPVPGPRHASRLADTAVRLALLAVAAAQAGLAWPALASGAAAMSAPVHVAHETGAWNLAVAAAFLAVAAAPRLAAGGAAVPRHVRRAARPGDPGRPGRRARARRPGAGPPPAPGRGGPGRDGGLARAPRGRVAASVRGLGVPA